MSGLFNQGSGFSFGQKPAQANTGFSFGQPGQASQSNQSQPGAQSQNGTGGLFGQNTQNNQPGGLFGKPAQPSLSFGQSATNTTNNTNAGGLGGGGLFGAANNANKPLFGASSQTSTPTPGTTPAAAKPGGLFGNAPAPPSGGLFGQTPQANTSTGFGHNRTSSVPAISTPPGGGLFGQANTSASANTSSTGLFGAPKPAGGLFGQPASGSLFGQKPAGTGLFGQAQTAQTGQANQTGQSSGLFGQKPAGLFSAQNGTPSTANGTFSAGTALNGAQNNTQNGSQGSLIATIDQGSYSLAGVTVAPKLYTSLSLPADAKHKEPSTVKAATLPKLTETVKVSLKRQRPEPQQHSKPRQWLNSYEAYVSERPTNLVIRRSKRLAVTIKDSDKPVSVEKGQQNGQQNGKEPKQNDSFTIVDQSMTVDLSLFHKQPNAVTLVRVNKKALEQGYYMRPSLDELTAYSKQQLAQVANLVIGREGFGQLEYPKPVDLSQLENLGDILGTLVVFNRGTVCVYPEEDAKAPEGTQLNVPCTVTIENAYPLDKQRVPIKAMSDPRMAQHIDRLKAVVHKQGGEFVTFTHGIWVFKVPHFSVWGLPADEMVIEEPQDISKPWDALPDERPSIFSSFPVQPALPVEKVAPPVDIHPFQAPEGKPECENDERVLPPHPHHSENVDMPDADADADAHAEEKVTEDEEQEEGADLWTSILARSQILAASEPALAQSSADAPLTTTGLSDMLFPKQSNPPHAQLRMPANLLRSSQLLVRANTASGVKQVFLPPVPPLPVSQLVAGTTQTPRPGAPAGAAALLSTALSFSKLQELAPQHRELWSLCDILFSAGAVSSVAAKLSQWLERACADAVRAELAAATSDLDTVWVLISGHRLAEASARAVASGNPHLATTIALLGDPNAQADAQAQLDDWKETNVITRVPAAVRKIFELAAGHTATVPAYSANGKHLPAIDMTQGLDWKRALGLKLWYGGSGSRLPALVDQLDGSGVELDFLRLYERPQNLAAALANLGLGTAFLVLLALQSPDTRAYDRVCAPLALDMLQSRHVASALFVAGYIVSAPLAAAVVQAILSRSPSKVDHLAEFGVPRALALKAQALYARSIGNYRQEAELLLQAGETSQAQAVLISKVAPQSVIADQLDQVVPLLQKVPTNTAGWSEGVKVYLDFAKLKGTASTAAPAGASSGVLANSLATALAKIPTPDVEVRAAVALMAGYVAAHSGGSLFMSQILSMKLGASQYRLQALQQSVQSL